MKDKPYQERLGGSYRRDKDTGRLERVAGTEEAPQPKPAPAAAETVPAELADKPKKGK